MRTTVVRLGPDVRRDPVRGFLREGDVVELQSHRPERWRPGDAEEWSVLEVNSTNENSTGLARIARLGPML
jgi:hypothetical protein